MSYSASDPYDTHISNPHRDDFWTCPACLTDLGDIGAGDHVCQACGSDVHCTVEYEPACHSRLNNSET